MQEALAKITWYHNVILMDEVKDIEERKWYISQTIKNGWSTNVLKNQIKDELYERQAIADKTTNFENTLPDIQSDLALQTLKDPYIFDFKEYFIDLLFYHLELRCYIVVELKAREFFPIDAGQLNFYLSAVDDILRKDGDNPTIGIILCQYKDKLVAEYALKDINKPVGVSEYKLLQDIPEYLQSQLPKAEEIELHIKYIEEIEKMQDNEE